MNIQEQTTKTPTPEGSTEERGGIPLVIIGWLLGIPGIILLLLLFV